MESTVVYMVSANHYNKHTPIAINVYALRTYITLVQCSVRLQASVVCVHLLHTSVFSR